MRIGDGKLHEWPRDPERLRYLTNQGILKDYQGEFYRLVAFKALPEPGQERGYTEKGTVNDSKLENNVSRARSKVYELAVCNPWAFWGTFTLDPAKYNRQDIDKFRKDLGQFIRDERKRTGGKLDYLTIPELHADGEAWHMHGLLDGVPGSELRRFTLKERLPQYIRDKLAKGAELYDWPRYRERFGYVCIEAVRNKQAVTKYILKYVTKELAESMQGLGKHLYYRSRGLLEASEMKRGTITGMMAPDYENDYVRIQEIPPAVELESILQHFFGISIPFGDRSMSKE